VCCVLCACLSLLPPCEITTENKPQNKAPLTNALRPACISAGICLGVFPLLFAQRVRILCSAFGSAVAMGMEMKSAPAICWYWSYRAASPTSFRIPPHVHRTSGHQAHPYGHVCDDEHMPIWASRPSTSDCRTLADDALVIHSPWMSCRLYCAAQHSKSTDWAGAGRAPPSRGGWGVNLEKVHVVLLVLVCQ
jgi:hypothetical protein